MLFQASLKKKQEATNVLAALISTAELWIFQGGKYSYHFVQKLQSLILSA